MSSKDYRPVPASPSRASRSGMDITAALRSGLRNMNRNKLRSGLTMLGIMIAVAAVICMLAIGGGASLQVEQAISTMGVNMIWIEAQGMAPSGVRTGHGTIKTLVMEDVTAIKGQVPWITDISPNVDTRIQVAYGNQNWNTVLHGVGPDYIRVANWQIERGVDFGAEEVQNAARVCILGHTVEENLFPNEDPLDKMIRVKGMPCQVIGLLKAKGQSAMGQDQDDTLLVPYTTAQKKILGITWLDDVLCSAVNTAAIPAAEEQISQLLRERHGIRPGMYDDFNLRHPVEIAKAVEDSTKVMKLLLASIASVSLLVGGIGIMNIMLVSVTERTREIGLRMAIGAREGDILVQFLTEAMILSFLGGAAGLMIGLLASMVVPRVLGWFIHVSPTDILIAVLFSCGVGVFFGYYPARKAARLDPIEALRYE